MLPDSPMNQLPRNFVRDKEFKFSVFGGNDVCASSLLVQVEAPDAMSIKATVVMMMAC